MKSKDLSLSFKNEFKLYSLKFKDQSLDFKEYIWLLKKKSLTFEVQSLKFHEWSLNNFFFVKYKEESLVFKDQSTRIQTSFFEI